MYHEFLRDQFLCVSMSRVVVKCLYWTVVHWALGSSFVLVNLNIVFPAEMTDYSNVHQPLGQHMHMVFLGFLKRARGRGCRQENKPFMLIDFSDCLQTNVYVPQTPLVLMDCSD